MRKQNQDFSVATLSWVLGMFAIMPIASGADVNVDASATFRSAIETTVEQHMDFGTIDFNQPNIGDVTLTPTGNMSYGTGTSGAATATPAIINVSGDVGAAVSISCSANTTISNGTHILNLQNINFQLGSGGSGTCSGLGNGSDNFTISGTTTDNQVSIGGTINNPSGNVTSSVYSTALTAPITLRLLYL